MATPQTPVLTPDELRELCRAAVRAAGGGDRTAEALAEATVAAELRGKPAVGAAHLLDYLDALRAGRLNGDPHPQLTARRRAAISIDADQGAAQVAFDHGLASLVEAARASGIAVLSIGNCFSAGELAHYTTRVAEHGLVVFAGTNSPALMAVHGSSAPVTGTNPLSFALPHRLGPRVFDQASSATAWVSVRDAAYAAEPIPEGWAVNADGEPTTDATAALAGALLPFGGVKGGNIAVMVDTLAALSGGSFSLDAAPFDSGSRSPALGLFVIAIDPAAFDPDFAERAEAHHQRLTADHGIDFGRRKHPSPTIQLPPEVYDALRGNSPEPRRSPTGDGRRP